MLAVVISGDIIASTSLSDRDRTSIENALAVLIGDLKRLYSIYGRVIKGDYIEFVVPEPKDALRIALAIKAFVKSTPVRSIPANTKDSRLKLFKTHGIRLAIGYGDLSRYDPEKGIIDGEAIYYSGRTINDNVTYNKQKVIIKNTLFFKSNNAELNSEFDVIFSLLDTLLSKATSRQCKVLYLKLIGFNEEAISKELQIYQSTVNQHSRSIGWNAIEKAVLYFESRIIQP